MQVDGGQQPGRQAAVGLARQVTRRGCWVRSARVPWRAPGSPADGDGTALRLKPQGREEESQEPGVTVRIASTAPVRAGDPWQGREKWRLKTDF